MSIMGDHIVPCHSRFHEIATDLIREDKGSPYLFVNRLARTPGKRYTHKALALIWRKACEAAREPYIELYSGLKHSSMSQYINEKGLLLAELQVISGHAKLDSVKKYAAVELDRVRELMEREPVEAEKIRMVK